MFNVITEPVVSVSQHHRLEIEYITNEERSFDKPFGTDFIVVTDGTLTSQQISGSGTFCAALTQPYKLAITGKALVIHTYGTTAMDSISFPDVSGPGALSYIDGCSNTNVISPLRNGDPCLNYLYFPAGTTQTLHTHPSVRVGIVLSGEGVAVSPHDESHRVPLMPGTAFLLDRYTLHAFNTEGSPMSLFAFHPDSEDGPTDEGNPMKTRTYLR